MIRRGVLFAAWALIGMVASYGVLYAFTPYGLAILAACAAGAWLLRLLSGSRAPETLGLLAGPGLFCWLVAYSADDPAAWTAAGAAIVAAASAAYVRAGRARCARRA
jgi:hypothetical protein